MSTSLSFQIFSPQAQSQSRVFTSGSDRFVRLGSLASAQVRLDDPRAARVHAIVQLTRTGATLRDVGSRHGTFVNGEPVRAPVRLEDGDVIRIGDTHLTVWLQQQSPARPRTAGHLHLVAVGGGAGAESAREVIAAAHTAPLTAASMQAQASHALHLVSEPEPSPHAKDLAELRALIAQLPPAELPVLRSFLELLLDRNADEPAAFPLTQSSMVRSVPAWLQPHSGATTPAPLGGLTAGDNTVYTGSRPIMTPGERRLPRRPRTWRPPIEGRKERYDTRRLVEVMRRERRKNQLGLSAAVLLVLGSLAVALWWRPTAAVPKAPAQQSLHSSVSKVEGPRIDSPQGDPEPAAGALLRTYEVRRGDTLGSIAARQLGDRHLWRELFDANHDQLRSPGEIEVGMRLRLPH